MKELIEKISSYNIFNYLFPGVVFAFLTTKLTSTKLIFDDIFVGAFAYYFIGLIISRIGSVIIEPIFKWLKIIQFADYKDFVLVSKKDEKLEILSESNNMYRTIVSLFLVLLSIIVAERIFAKWVFFTNNQDIIIIVLLLTLFIFSYRKQTNFIVKRIKTLK